MCDNPGVNPLLLVKTSGVSGDPSPANFGEGNNSFALHNARCDATESVTSDTAQAVSIPSASVPSRSVRSSEDVHPPLLVLQADVSQGKDDGREDDASASGSQDRNRAPSLPAAKKTQQFVESTESSPLSSPDSSMEVDPPDVDKPADPVLPGDDCSGSPSESGDEVKTDPNLGEAFTLPFFISRFTHYISLHLHSYCYFGFALEVPEDSDKSDFERDLLALVDSPGAPRVSKSKTPADKKTRRRTNPISAAIITSDMDMDLDDDYTGTHTTPSLQTVQDAISAQRPFSPSPSDGSSALTPVSSSSSDESDDIKPTACDIMIAEASYILPPNAPLDSELSERIDEYDDDDDDDNTKSYILLQTVHMNMSSKLFSSLGTSSNPIDVDALCSFFDPGQTRTHVGIVAYVGLICELMLCLQKKEALSISEEFTSPKSGTQIHTAYTGDGKPITFTPRFHVSIDSFAVNVDGLAKLIFIIVSFLSYIFILFYFSLSSTFIMNASISSWIVSLNCT